MKRPDVPFWADRDAIEEINRDLGSLSKYTEIEGVPMDLNHPRKREIAAFQHYATSLEDKYLEGLQVVDRIKTYTAMMEEILSEKENESLPVEGNPGHLVGQ